MTETVKKKKSTALLFLLAFAVLVVVTLIANYKSQVVLKLRGPDAGVEKLSIIDNRLIAISRENETYVWDWNNLSGWPQVGRVDAQKMTAFYGDRLLWVPAGSSNVLVVSNLKGDKELKRLPLEEVKGVKLLETSANGRYAVTALELYDAGRIRLAVIDPNLTAVSEVVTETMEDKSKINSVSISNDGNFMAAAGTKGGGWIFVAETRSKKILWEQSVKSSVELNKVIFSPDGRWVYASEPGRYIYVFEAATGKTAKQFIMDKYEDSAVLNNMQTIGMLAASPDGRLFAATVEPGSTAWVWDIKTGEKITCFGGGFTISGLAFSPDSSLLVTGILVRSNINIWNIPKRR